ncbi:hypothetical protein [Thalassotalea sp. ND16A]|uniref:hypothetical protein n=1 Tax=Thalassotalea sp. ND16A TaxID=1535422 RepID=UPI00051A3F88|nr:hypothetical protein [Thalassotalea sp. ND16A]KGJ87994.1 hypothetical protein ND16A_2547 [Thalassotalea sp. ND16A]
MSSWASSQIDKGVITNQAGYYTREAIYANLILKAKELGFEIVSYDQHKPTKLNTIDERETNAALTIKEKIFDKDPDSKKWDISVFWPRTTYLNGRPSRASLDRKKYSLDSNDCKNLYPCMVEVFKFNRTDEVPLDRVIISSKEEPKTVFLSQGNNIIVMSDSNGNLIRKITVQN